MEIMTLEAQSDWLSIIIWSVFCIFKAYFYMEMQMPPRGHAADAKITNVWLLKLQLDIKNVQYVIIIKIYWYINLVDYILLIYFIHLARCFLLSVRIRTVFNMFLRSFSSVEDYSALNITQKASRPLQITYQLILLSRVLHFCSCYPLKMQIAIRWQ